MLNKVMKRAAEPSSYAGLAGILMGLDALFDINEAQPIVDAAGKAGEIVMATGNPTFGLAMLVSGILAALLPEKKQ
ncbi:MAG: hypothetical protein H6863_06505 [Rhodospirillales bacterium]|nr:hypothetical protein [Rhodospirillales bacterium]